MSDNNWLSVTEAIDNMLEHAACSLALDTVPLAQALDRVLAENMVAPLDVPAYDNSAMDGYALRYADASLEQPLRVVGTVLAGQSWSSSLPVQSAVRIMTGAPIPAECDCVIMQEQTRVDGEQLWLTAMPKQHDHIRPQGDDVQQGQVLLTAGQRLTPMHIGLLASLGVAEVPVYRRLRVALFSSGDELRLPGQALPEHCIYDSNRFALMAMLQRLAVDAVDLGLIADDPSALREAFVRGQNEADVLISSAGVSVGDADHTKTVLAELGDVGFWKVAMKPGKPFAFGRLASGWFFGLPGNPVSAVVTMDQLVQPILRQLAGEVVVPVRALPMRSASAIKKRPGRADYQRAHYDVENGTLVVRPLANQSSGVLTSMVKANAYIRLPADQGSLAAGSEVDVLPFSTLLQ